MTDTRPTISGGRVGAAPLAATPLPVQPATLRPATAAVAPPSPYGGRPRRGTVARSPPPIRGPLRLPRRRPAWGACSLRARTPRQPPRRRPLPPLAPALHPGSTRRRRRRPHPRAARTSLAAKTTAAAASLTPPVTKACRRRQ